MAKFKRTSVGSVMKSKDPGKPDFIKLNPVTMNELASAIVKADKQKGLFLNLESKKNQEDSVNKALTEGKLSEETAQKILARLSKMPPSVRFEIVLLEKSE